jgi:hypothetical protein
MDPEIDLRRLGITPQKRARAERLREELRASGLTLEEYQRQLETRLDAAYKELDATKSGWGLPIGAGFIGTLTLSTLWTSFSGRPHWAPLLSTIGTCLTMLFLFDRERLPPRRRMIGGLAIGACLAGLLLSAALLG